MSNKFSGRNGKVARISVFLQNGAVNGDTIVSELLSKNSKIEEHKAGDIIITQGANDRDVFFLLSGDVDIEVDNQITATRSAPRSIGEMSAIDPKHVRSATVIAKSDLVVTARISAVAFSKLCEDHIGFLNRLNQDVRDRFQERLKLPMRDANSPTDKNNNLKWILSCFLIALAIFIITIGVFYIPNLKLQLVILSALTLASVVGMFAYWRHEKFFYKNLIRVWVVIGAGVLALNFRILLSASNDGANMLFNMDSISPATTSIVWVVAFGLLLLVDHFHTRKYVSKLK